MVDLKKYRNKTRFSILNKLVIFGTLILIAGFTMGGATFYIAKAPIHELTGSIQALKNAMRILWVLMVVMSILITIVCQYTIEMSPVLAP